jgi:NAD(P)-dependent dehydrogenase (short-subunit alcohol dehydrogenase family)
MRLARLALPGMRDDGRGRIVNVSSIFGRTTTPLTGWYQATKHALEAASDALRMEVAGDGIQVVLVQPGGFTTSIWDGNEQDIARHADSRFADAYQREMRLTRLAQPFMGDPQQVAALIGRVLDARWNRARYLIGADAHAAAVLEQFTPTALKDRITRFGFGL